MKPFATFIFAAFLVATTAVGQAQSLADIANKEKQRREKISEAPEEITNVEAAEYSGGSVSTVKPIALPSVESDSENIEGENAESSEKVADPDEPVDFEGRTESYWRETMTAARQKVMDLESEATALILKMNDLENQFYNIDDGFNRDGVQKEIQKTFYLQDLNKENLSKAKKDLEDLEKEARKSGALPGWLD